MVAINGRPFDQQMAFQHSALQNYVVPHRASASGGSLYLVFIFRIRRFYVCTTFVCVKTRQCTRDDAETCAHLNLSSAVLGAKFCAVLSSASAGSRASEPMGKEASGHRAHARGGAGGRTMGMDGGLRGLATAYYRWHIRMSCKQMGTVQC